MSEVTLLNMCMIEKPGTGQVVALDKVGSNWDGLTFPGGHVEPGESLCASVVREVWEETGLTVHNPRLCGVVHWYKRDTGGRFLVFLYRANAYEGVLHGGTREGRVFWMNLEEMMRHPGLSDGMRDYFNVFLRPEVSEAYAEQDGGVESAFCFN
jgi:8-oxo-dGTP diphosphatase